MTQIIRKQKNRNGYRIFYECDYCGKETSKQESRFNETGGNYCSHSCYSDDRRGKRLIETKDGLKKECSNCNEVKGISHFNKRGKERNGWQPWCRECKAKQRKDWHQRNKEYANKVSREYYHKNKEKCSQLNRQYKQKHREHCNELERIRIEQKRAGGGEFIGEEWEQLKEKFNYTCPACGRSEPEIKLEVDHIIPVSKGGTGNIENIQPLCSSCNSKKYTDIIFYEWINIP